jgi:DNA-binding winged helix-turn-helix (wHTH) protein/pimeloyl-ACP methyl ester carboxylesterase
MPHGSICEVFEFGPFRLEVKEHRLSRDHRFVQLTGKAFSTLRVLVERHGTLVSKHELMTEVWPNTVVEENNLDRNISTLRKALGDQKNGEPYIETVPRLGYRFIAPVKEASPIAVVRMRARESSSTQEIRFCVTSDQVRLAYSTAGTGHPLVKVASCFNHLGFEWESPIWRHWIADLAPGHTLFRYDGRGNGLSDWQFEDCSFGKWVHDLETAVDAAELEKFALFGHSQGGAVAIAYAARHPERVSHLILCGAYARGVCHRGNPELIEVRRALQTLLELNWGKTNPAFFQVVTELYIPERATAEDKKWFGELQLVSMSPANLVRIMRACDELDVRPLLPAISVPTIVFHSECDRVAPFQEGKLITSGIPGARFVPLPSSNHVLLENEPAWNIFRDELASFLAQERKSGSRANARAESSRN